MWFDLSFFCVVTIFLHIYVPPTALTFVWYWSLLISLNSILVKTCIISPRLFCIDLTSKYDWHWYTSRRLRSKSSSIQAYLPGKESPTSSVPPQHSNSWNMPIEQKALKTDPPSAITVGLTQSQILKYRSSDLFLYPSNNNGWFRTLSRSEPLNGRLRGKGRVLFDWGLKFSKHWTSRRCQRLRANEEGPCTSCWSK